MELIFKTDFLLLVILDCPCTRKCELQQGDCKRCVSGTGWLAHFRWYSMTMTISLRDSQSSLSRGLFSQCVRFSNVLTGEVDLGINLVVGFWMHEGKRSWRDASFNINCFFFLFISFQMSFSPLSPTVIWSYTQGSKLLSFYDHVRGETAWLHGLDEETQGFNCSLSRILINSISNCTCTLASRYIWCLLLLSLLSFYSKNQLASF